MSLAKHLARQSATLAQFILLLEDEQRALAQGQVDGQRLSELAAGKQALRSTVSHSKHVSLMV